MEISSDKFELKKAAAEHFYKSLNPLKCPYFNGDHVYFNAEGFEHLIFKGWNKTRSKQEQYVRFRLLPMVVSVIRKSGTLQEFDERNMFVRRKSKDGWNKIMKIVRYYVFVAIVDDFRLKVIIKEIDGGQKNFHSVYPSWKIEPDGWGSHRKKLYSGNLETD